MYLNILHFNCLIWSIEGIGYSIRYMLPIKSHCMTYTCTCTIIILYNYNLFFFLNWIGKICFQKWKDIWGNVCQWSHCGVSRFHHGRNHYSRYKSDPNKDSSSIWCVNFVELIFELLIQKYVLVILISLNYRKLNSNKFYYNIFRSTLSFKCRKLFFFSNESPFVNGLYRQSVSPQ